MKKQEISTVLSTLLSDRGIDQTLWSAIGGSIFPGASEDSILLAYDYCKARGLDILKKPCHIVPMNVKDAKTNSYSWRDVIMPGIAEARITANRTGKYAGQDAPIFGEMVELNFGGANHTVPEFCTVTVYRMVSKTRMACSHTEFFEEACGTNKAGALNAMWTKRKRGQLAKCAEAGALRKAFPEELGGINTVEEMEGAQDIRNVTKRSMERTTTIDPSKQIEGGEHVEVESQTEEAPAPKEKAKVKTVEPVGKQKKERREVEVAFQGISEKEAKGTTWFDVSVTIRAPKKNGEIGDKPVTFVTYSTTHAEHLRELEKGTKIKISVVETTVKGMFQIESYELISTTPEF
jgi:phage recombination protein Bet